MTMTVDQRPDAAPSATPVFSREVRILGLCFAGTLFVIASIVWGLAGVDPIETAIPKLIGITGDACLAVLVTLALWRIRTAPLGIKALAAIAMSLLAAPISGLIDWGLHIAFVYPEPVPFDPAYFAQVVIFTTSELFGWSCLYLALQYSAEVREIERHMADLRHQATTAQLRALQYQINPHFLFNTLNAISGLIEEEARQGANDMVQRLAGFLRKTLALDPLSDLRLEEEIALQRDYLGIEMARFSDRLSLRIDIAPELHDALVPALLLQPLIENAIRHGVARIPGPVDLLIEAYPAPDGMLVIGVENPVPPTASGAGGGLGIGLQNVAERLATRYPEIADPCTLLRPKAGRLRVELKLPCRK